MIFTRGILLLALACASLSLASAKINLRDADIKVFISDMAGVTNKTFVVDPRVKGSVTVASEIDLSIDEAYEVFKSVMAAHAYSVVDYGNLAKIVPEVVGRTEFQANYSENSLSDGLSINVFRPENISAKPLVALLKPITNRSGHLEAFVDANAVLIADKASNITKIMNIANELDRLDQDLVELISLKNSSSKEMAKMLNDLHLKSASNRTTAQFNAFGIDRINAVLLVGNQEVTTKMKSIAFDLDNEVSESKSLKVRYLKYASAEEIKDILTNVAENIDKSPQGSSGGKIKTSISAHKETNSLIINADPDILGQLEDVIDKIDIRRAQVLVEAIIVEISEQLTKDLGVQILFQGDGVEQPAFGTRFGSPNPDLTAFAASSSSLLAEEGLAGTVKSVAASSLLGIEGIAVGIGKIVAGQSSFASILNAIAKDSDSNVLSTPSILTMDNETSSILVGQEIPITTGESLGANNANPFRTINRQEIGIKLLVTPQINDGDSIRLDIEQEVSSLFGPITESASEIITNKREIQTKVMVEDRQTVVLGGLIDEDIQEVERKVPGLGDIPVFGNLFKSTSKSKVKRNLVVFLKPTIIKNAADMQTISTEKYNFLKAEQLLLEKRGKPVVDLSLIETFLEDQ